MPDQHRVEALVRTPDGWQHLSHCRTEGQALKFLERHARELGTVTEYRVINGRVRDFRYERGRLREKKG